MTASSKFAAKKATVTAKRRVNGKDVPISAADMAAIQAAADKPFVDPLVDEALRSYSAAQDTLLSAFKVPSGTRLLCAAVAGIVTYASSVWFAVPMVEVISLAAVSLTGMPFLGFLVWVLGVFAVFLSSMIAAYQAAKFVASFDLEHAADVGRGVREAAKRRVSQVRGWFKRSDSAVQYDNVGTC